MSPWKWRFETQEPKPEPTQIPQRPAPTPESHHSPITKADIPTTKNLDLHRSPGSPKTATQEPSQAQAPPFPKKQVPFQPPPAQKQSPESQQQRPKPARDLESCSFLARLHRRKCRQGDEGYIARRYGREVLRNVERFLNREYEEELDRRVRAWGEECMRAGCVGWPSSGEVEEGKVGGER